MTIDILMNAELFTLRKKVVTSVECVGLASSVIEALRNIIRTNYKSVG